MPRKKVVTLEEFARKGALARNASQTPEERKESGRHAANTRWSRMTPEERREATEKMRRARRKK
jgi:hypothetical protein